MKKYLPLFFILISFWSFGQKQTTQPYQNTSIKRGERIEDLLKRLTVEEKIGLMMNRSLAVKRLGIPEYDWWNEALHGVARAGYATVFPQAIAMAATFNDADHFNTFSMISDEARAKYHKAISEGNRQIFYGLSFWTPNINIFRDPRWGRGMETYGEDPYLTSRFGVNAVKGLQGNDSDYFKTLACAKHFAVHSGPEWNRHSYNAQVSDKDLWETYLPAFESLVRESNVQQVMCAYNRFEDSPCCGSGKLLIDILRNKWNYKGLVVSDCWAIDDFYKPGHHNTHKDSASASIAAVLNGTDIECGRSYESLIKAVKLGLINESDIDVSVRRILTARFNMGMFDADSRVKWSGIPYNVVDCPLHKAQALKVARESITLLKNANSILPLSKSLKTIAVIGANANDSVMMWANYNGYPTSTTTILKGIQNKMPNARIIYEKGCDLVDKTVKTGLMNCLSSNGKQGMYAEYFNNTHWEGKPVYTTHGVEQFNFSTSGGTQFAPNVNLENFTARYTGEFIAPYTGKFYFSLKADDSYRLLLNGVCAMEASNYEKAKNNQVYVAKYKKGEKIHVQLDYLQLTLNGNLDFSIYNEKSIEFSNLKNKIKNADIIIYVGGLSARLEGEEMPVEATGFKGGDRVQIELPNVQKDILKELHSTGKPVVFVLCTGSAIALTEDEPNYNALLNAWYGGQAGGTAVADVLFGDYNPAGRLPITFYKSTAQLPDFEDYSMSNRTYRFFKDTALYAFGYGLSYTKFKYENPTINSSAIKTGENAKVSINVSNIGKRDGDEVVQLYISHKNSNAEPIKTLKAFKRINIKVGESKHIDFELLSEAFKTYDSTKNEMSIVPGDYEIMIGSSSLEKDLQTIKLTIK